MWWFIVLAVIVLVVLLIAIPVLLVIYFIYNSKSTWGGDCIDEKELALRKNWADDELHLRHSKQLQYLWQSGKQYA